RKRLGWVRVKELPLVNFLCPFRFHGIRVDGFGKVDFEATFDDRFLVIFYHVQEFSRESPHFFLKSDRVGADIGEVAAVHYIDLDTLEHLGFLPLTEATYTQKNFDLTFTDAKAIVYFENEKIRIEQIEMRREDLVFQGEMRLAINHIDDVDLTIETQHIHGPASQAQDILSHFVPSVFWDVPLDGQIECMKDDLFFHFAFQPKSKLLEGRVRGELHADYQAAPLTISDISTSFDYDFQANRMIFSEGTGSFMLNETPYRLVVPEITLKDFPRQQINLEIDVWQENEKVLSLEGRTEGDQLKRQLFIDSNLFSLRGEQEGSRVSIHHFHSEKCAGTAEIDWTEKNCYIDNLELLAQGIGAFSLEGALNRQTWTFTGKINDFEVHLDTFSSHPPVEKALALWNPEGTIRGKGAISYQLTEKKLEVETQASFAGLEFGGVHFGDGEDLTCHYRSDQGLTVEGLEVDIPGAEKYKLGQFHYHLESQKILFESFDFSLPPEKLPWVTEMLTRLFPGKIHPTIVDLALALKENEPLDGSISLELFPKQIWINLTLKDGLYSLSGKQLDLKNFSLTYDPLELKLRTQYNYLDDYYWVDLMVDSMTLSHGEAAIEDDNGRLVGSWERRRDRGWCGKSLQGEFCGFDVQLDAKKNLDFSKTIQLVGRVGVDLERASRLMPADLQKVVTKFGMGQGYFLSGDFVCPKDNPSDFQFTGTLSGEEFFLGGTQLASLSSNATYTGDRFELTDLTIEDWSGSLSMAQAMMTKQNDHWTVDIPHIALESLRPARLRSEQFKKNKKSKTLFKSLFISSGELHQLRGIVGEQTSFEGSGDLQFTNLPRRNFLSPVLYLPTEITARIGLDLSLLVPARGTIRYEIMDGRIYLTKFKDMYSDGKRSRFYLAQGHPAYIDFDGNLYMKVKMKQYNLLMKLAEFFTVTVKGSVFKPAYTLTNQFDE
ncbi:MAG: hypothetical protein K1000chlam4_00680, partial [Chlamydiae bacterium]|nr:hypothetical protein [Chlamydiota bacterium]